MSTSDREPTTSDTATDEVPETLAWAARIARIQALALLVCSIVLCLMAIFRTSTRLWAALAIAGFALLAAAILALCARGLLALRPTARSPVLLIELLALPVCYSLGFQAGRIAIALPIMLSALAVLVLLFTPAARRALDRVL